MNWKTNLVFDNLETIAEDINTLQTCQDIYKKQQAYQDDVKSTLFVDKIQERLDSSQQSCLSTRFENESISGDEHAALTKSHDTTEHQWQTQ